MKSDKFSKFSKVVRLGFRQGVGNVFCKVEYNGLRLSITGVEGPMKGGNALGACGQILGSYLEDGGKVVGEIRPASGWNADKIRDEAVLEEFCRIRALKADCLIENESGDEE